VRQYRKAKDAEAGTTAREAEMCVDGTERADPRKEIVRVVKDGSLRSVQRGNDRLEK
jgi:hypothetical protein